MPLDLFDDPELNGTLLAFGFFTDVLYRYSLSLLRDTWSDSCNIAAVGEIL